MKGRQSSGRLGAACVFMLVALCAAAKPALQEGKPENRRVSAAARENPALREFFKERYSSISSRMEADGNSFLLDRTLDRLIDQHTEKTLTQLEELHAQRDRVQTLLAPAVVDYLKSLESRQRPPVAAAPAQVLGQLRVALDRIEDLAKDIDSSMVFLRYSLYVSLKYDLEKTALPRAALLRGDVETVIETIGKLETAVYEFYFPQKSSVSLEGLKEDSIPRRLEKIRKHAERAKDALKGY